MRLSYARRPGALTRRFSTSALHAAPLHPYLYILLQLCMPASLSNVLGRRRSLTAGARDTFHRTAIGYNRGVRTL